VGCPTPRHNVAPQCETTYTFSELLRPSLRRWTRCSCECVFSFTRFAPIGEPIPARHSWQGIQYMKENYVPRSTPNADRRYWPSNHGIDAAQAPARPFFKPSRARPSTAKARPSSVDPGSSRLARDGRGPMEMVLDQGRLYWYDIPVAAQRPQSAPPRRKDTTNPCTRSHCEGYDHGKSQSARRHESQVQLQAQASTTLSVDSDPPSLLSPESTAPVHFCVPSTLGEVAIETKSLSRCTSPSGFSDNSDYTLSSP